MEKKFIKSSRIGQKPPIFGGFLFSMTLVMILWNGMENIHKGG